MKNYCLLNYDYLFSDNLGKLSDQAKLYFVKLMFYANNGFVSNPIQVLDSLNYDRSVYNELLCNGDILKIDGRDEIFITSFFVHNKGVNRMSWLNTPFATYWKGKLFIKPNGIATFKIQKEQSDSYLYDERNDDKLF